jgi:hypothetical protein
MNADANALNYHLKSVRIEVAYILLSDGNVISGNGNRTTPTALPTILIAAKLGLF